MHKGRWARVLAAGFLAVLAAGVTAGCQGNNRVIDPLPDPPMGALRADGGPAIPRIGGMGDVGPSPWQYQPAPPRPPTPTDGGRGPTPGPPRTGPGYRIVIDPGHGGKDDGATSVYGLREKRVNLAVALEVGRLLQQRGQNVLMTRATDVYVALDDRARIANNFKANLFVSIHSDSAENASADGFSIYVSRSASQQSRSLGANVEAAMRAAGRRRHGKDVVKNADFRVLVQTACPAILVELGFLSNRREAAMLGQTTFQSRQAQAVARGICNALGVR
jgi:N-acetylmuramoyl-L-alanine amidase